MNRVGILIDLSHCGERTTLDAIELSARPVAITHANPREYVGAPVFGVFANDNKPRFRDGKPWPESILQGDGRGQEAGYKAVNARSSWEAGVVYGYGTDTQWPPKETLLDELRDTTASIYFAPDIFVYDLIQARIDHINGVPVVAVMARAERCSVHSRR